MAGRKIKAADGGDITIPDSEWYINTKPRARRMMLNSLSGEARQVYACLELGTMAFSQERAVILKDGCQIPMTFAYIAEQTRLRRQHIHDRYWPELEAAGLAEARPINPDLPLQKGNIELFSWSEPQAPKKKFVPARGYKMPEWAPPSWADKKSTVGKFLKRNKIEFPPDFVPARDYVDEVESKARAYEKAEASLRALLDLSRAPEKPPALPINERKGKESSSSAALAKVANIEARKADEEEDSPPTFDTFRRLYPSRQFDEAKAKRLFEELSLAERRKCIRSLKHDYLNCDRWKDRNGQFIPWAAKWLKLKSYNSPPPPAFSVGADAKNDDMKKHIQSVAALARRMAGGE